MILRLSFLICTEKQIRQKLKIGRGREMRKQVLKIMAIVAFLTLVIGLNVPLKAYAEELYKEDTVTIRLDYTNFQYAEVEMPSDGYIIISHEETMISIGIDSTDEFNAHRIYGEDEYKVNLKKGNHRIYLFDGAGTRFFENEYATVHYKIYIDKDNDTETSPMQDDYKYYVIDEQSCGIKSYVGKSSEIVIPSEINGYRVIVIGQKCFANRDFIKKITIPKSIQEIEDEAFSECYSLSSVTFGDGSQLKKMGEDIFSDCEDLKKVVLPKNLKKIEAGTFSGCKKLSGITFESGSKLQSIGEDAFRECKSLKKIVLPKSIQKIEDSAFMYCRKLSEVTFESGNKLQKIGEDAFSECTNLKKIVIPKNVKTIAGGAFYNCKNMVSITFQSGSKLQKIEEEAFSDCKKLKKITLTSKKIKSIGEDAFYGINKKAVIKVPGSKAAKYKKLLGKKAGIKPTMKIVIKG